MRVSSFAQTSNIGFLTVNARVTSVRWAGRMKTLSEISLQRSKR